MSEIVLSDPLPEIFDSLTAGRLEIRSFDEAQPSDYQTAHGVIVYGHHRIDGEFMDRCPELRVISNHGVGVDHIDLEAARERNIPVGNTPGCLDASTADMTIALMLAVARNVVVGDQFARSPKFTHYDPSKLIGLEVTGRTLGIIGMGRIGTEVARRAKAFDMRILYCNRNPRPDIDQMLGTEHVSLDSILTQSDFVSLNCPLSPETTGLISREQLALMKPTAILLNLARGPVVDTEALHNALQTRSIAGAGLDVTDPEPLPRDHPLLGLENVVITPHLGSASDETRRRMMEMTIENVEAGLAQRGLPYRVI